MESFYDILEVSPNASQETIKAAYKSLAQRYHPDKNPTQEAADRIKKINVAYETLSIPEKRLRYDEDLRNQKETQAKESTDTDEYQKAIPVSPISYTPIKYKIYGVIGVLWAVSIVLHGSGYNNSFVFNLGSVLGVCTILISSLYYIFNKSKEFILLYTISFIVISPFVWYFGDYSSKGYMFNLTRAMIWPYIMFESSPTIDSTNNETLTMSIIDMVHKHNDAVSDEEGFFKLMGTIGNYVAIEYAKENPDFNMKKFNEIENSGQISYKMASKLASPELSLKAIKRLDGWSFGKIVRKNSDSLNELMEILSNRQLEADLYTNPATQATQPSITPETTKQAEANPAPQAPAPSIAPETAKQAEANLQAPVPGLALAQKEPEPAQAPPKETKPLTQAQATTDSVTAKAILPGTVFTTESFMLDKPDSKTIIEKKVIASGNGKMTVSSTNLNSKSKKPRIIEYTTEWNLLSSRNSDNSGWDFNPPIKYFDFPLYTGKKWNSKSIETNIRTGTTKEHIISATVGDWQTITVPAGTFKGIKVIAVTQVTDLSNGEKTSGTDTSWYVPDFGHSVKSITSSTNAEGKEQEQIIQLISYNEADRATSQDMTKNKDISTDDNSSSVPDNAKQVTAVVASFQADESGDGYTFKTTSGNEYYIYSNSDVKFKGDKLLEESKTKKSTICLTLADGGIKEVYRGSCKYLQVSAQTAWTPSFDCAKASTMPERIICSSKELSDADVKLNHAYKTALNESPNKEALKKEQNTWRNNERDACADAPCITKAYQKRIFQLLP